MGKGFSFDEIMERDSLLLQLSSYDVSKGMMMVPNDMERMYDIQCEIIERFNYFKGLIQSGETTLEDLQQDVSQRNGAIPQLAKEDSEVVNDLIEDVNFDNEKVRQLQTAAKRVSMIMNELIFRAETLSQETGIGPDELLGINSMFEMEVIPIGSGPQSCVISSLPESDKEKGNDLFDEEKPAKKVTKKKVAKKVTKKKTTKKAVKNDAIRSTKRNPKKPKD